MMKQMVEDSAGDPLSPRKSMAAAKIATPALSSISGLLVQGDNRQGLAHALAKVRGDAGDQSMFSMAQVVGRRYSEMFGFDNEADAAKDLIKKAVALVRKR